MEKADSLLLSLRQIAEANAQAAARVAQLGDRIRELAAHHRADVAAAGQTLLDVREVVRTSRRAGAGAGPALGADHRLHRPHQADLVADQPARAQRGDRGGPGGRARTRLRGRGRGSAPARRLQRHRRRGRGQDGPVHPHPGARRLDHDGGRLRQGAGDRVGGGRGGAGAGGDRQRGGGGARRGGGSGARGGGEPADRGAARASGPRK